MPSFVRILIFPNISIAIRDKISADLPAQHVSATLYVKVGDSVSVVDSVISSVSVTSLSTVVVTVDVVVVVSSIVSSSVAATIVLIVNLALTVPSIPTCDPTILI